MLLVYIDNILKQWENTTVLPLFHINRFISDFKHKAELFNDFLSNHMAEWNLFDVVNSVTVEPP